MEKEIWNHNYAYHKWIIKKVKDKNKILDVGSGNGDLVFKLKNNSNEVTGIELDSDMYKLSCNKNKYKNVKFIEGDFLKYNFKSNKYDAIIFVASIHHMDMKDALIKAKNLLNKNGIIIIVGLSTPSTKKDYLLEILRVEPSLLISKAKHMTTSEDLNIKTSYKFPSMNYVRDTIKEVLNNNYKITYGIHYRYLLYYENKELE